MARKKSKQQSAGETLDGMESAGDRLAEWIGENPLPILGAAAVILLVAAIFAFTSSYRETSRNDAAAALSQVQADYRVAMGATPTSIEVVEPANPETALQIRSEYVERYQQVAEEHAGTTAGALALLEAGKLQQQLGQHEEPLASFKNGLAAVPADDPVSPFLLARVANAHENAGNWSEAGEAYERASEVASFALRYDALTDAARSYAEAGDRSRALQAYGRLQSEAPEHPLPEYVEAKLEELRVAASPN